MCNEVIRTTACLFRPGRTQNASTGFPRKCRWVRTGQEGLADLVTIAELAAAAGYEGDRVLIDPSVVRGLEYYTGPVFEAELTFPVTDEARS